MQTPTSSQFNKYQHLYNYFNEQLFKQKLPPCLLILSRKIAKVSGHFSKNRWQDSEGNTAHEINLNPVYIAKSTDLEICQTLVCEMVHLWQQEYGKPSRPGYHNKQWAAKMESIGLTPSHTGQPGGKRTGQKMSHYPSLGGLFLEAFNKRPEKLRLPLKSMELIDGVVYINGVPAEENGQETLKKSRNRVKYACACPIHIWGKPGIKSFLCSACQQPVKVK